MPRILAMVLSGGSEIYHAMVAAIKRTWGAQDSPDFRTIYYWADQKDPCDGSIRQEENDIFCNLDMSVYAILPRTILAYAHVLKTLEFDFIFRCCCCSYLDWKELSNFLSTKPKERLWCGVTDMTRFGHPFVSGTGMILSRDVVSILVDGMPEIFSTQYPGYWDDVAVGQFLTKKGVSPDPDARRVDCVLDPVPGCYHYHVGPSVEAIEVLHSKISKR